MILGLTSRARDGVEATNPGSRLRRWIDSVGSVIALRLRRVTSNVCQKISGQLRAFPLRNALASQTVVGYRDEADCMLLDTTGDHQSCYRIATVVFVGNSLTSAGGQNPVEPILACKPVVFGPPIEHFAPLSATLISNNGAI